MKCKFTITPPLLYGGFLIFCPSCLHVQTDPIEIKPIHIVADINVKVQNQLDDFFSFEKQLDKSPATTQAVQQ